MWSVLVFLLVSTNGGNTRVLLSCHRLGRHTLPRGTLIREGDLNTNLIKDLCLFVTCFLFDIEANCLTCEEHYCEGLLISMSSYFKYVCHSQCDGTVLHMLCNQAHCLLSNSVTFLYLQKIGKQSVRREKDNVLIVPLKTQPRPRDSDWAAVFSVVWRPQTENDKLFMW